MSRMVSTKQTIGGDKTQWQTQKFEINFRIVRKLVYSRPSKELQSLWITLYLIYLTYLINSIYIVHTRGQHICTKQHWKKVPILTNYNLKKIWVQTWEKPGKAGSAQAEMLFRSTHPSQRLLKSMLGDKFWNFWTNIFHLETPYMQFSIEAKWKCLTDVQNI